MSKIMVQLGKSVYRCWCLTMSNGVATFIYNKFQLITFYSTMEKGGGGLQQIDIFPRPLYNNNCLAFRYKISGWSN